MKEVDYENLKCYMLKVLNKSISHSELTQLIKFSRILIQVYLNNIRRSLIYIYQQQGITTADLAYDCIAEAFSRDEKNVYFRLNSFINSFNGDIKEKPDIEVFVSYRSFLIKITDAHLSRLFSLSDPIGSKIYRNLKETILKTDLFEIQKDFGGFIITPKNVESLSHCSEFPLEILEEQLITRTIDKRNTKDYLKILYEILVEQSDYRRIIQLFDLVKVFKKISADEFYSNGENNFNRDLEKSLTDFTQFEINEISEKVGRKLKENIFLKYYTNGKLNREQSESIFYAIRDIIKDWIEFGESQESLYNYLHKHIKIDEEYYKNNFRTKLEYLVKIARDEFASYLNNEI